MPVSFKTGTFAKNGTTTGYPIDDTTSITGLGFQPKAFIFWALGSDTSPTTINRPTIGFSVDTGGGAGTSANYSIGWNTSNVIPTTSSRRAKNNTFYALNSAGDTPEIKIQSFTSDGATVRYVGNNDTNTRRIYYAALGGTTITNVKAGEFTLNTVSGTQDIDDVGFQPDIVFFIGADTASAAAATSSNATHSSWFFGAAKDASNENVIAFSSVDGVSTTDAARYQHTARSIAHFTSGSTSTTMDCEAEYVGTVATGTGGFRINILAPSASATSTVFYLAIKGGNWSVGSTLQPTTSTNVSVTGLGYAPKGVIFRSNQQETSFNNAVSTHERWSMGASDGTATAPEPQFALYGGVGDNLTAVPVSWRGNLLTDVIRTAAGSTIGDVTSTAQLTSFDSGGFTLAWIPADTVQRQHLYVTVGELNAVVKVANETVGVTEAVNAILGKRRSPAVETEAITEAPLKALGKVRIPTTETERITESPLKALGRVRFPATTPETERITEAVNKVIATPIVTLTATSIKLRFSGGAANSVNTSSRGGAISSVEVTNNTLNAAWDDVLTAESSAGRTEYRCFYLLNSDATLTAYSVQMWKDSNTTDCDSVEIGRGSAAISAQEQGPLAAETTAPTAVTFSTAPDEDSAVDLGDIPPSGYRSFWIKRIVPAGTSSWNDDTYILRVSFVSNHL